MLMIIVVVMMMHGCDGRESLDRILLVGNSFTFYNGGIWECVSIMAAPFYSGNISEYTVPGASLADHREDAESGRTRLSSLMEESWNLVQLQDFSRTPGQDDDDEDKIASMAAITEYFKPQIFNVTGGLPMLFMTWGYYDGYDGDDGIYPDYITMQRRLTAGYEQYLDLLTNDWFSCEAFMIPIGLGFERVYFDGPDSSHFQLYQPVDQYHPSEQGTLLASSVLFTALFGVSPVGAAHPFTNVISPDRAAYLQQVAYDVVMENRGRYQYPFECVQ